MALSPAAPITFISFVWLVQGIYELVWYIFNHFFKFGIFCLIWNHFYHRNSRQISQLYDYNVKIIDWSNRNRYLCKINLTAIYTLHVCAPYYIFFMNWIEKYFSQQCVLVCVCVNTILILWLPWPMFDIK